MRRLVLFLLVSAVLGASTSGAGAAFPGSNGRIAFQTDRSGASQLAVINPDGSGFRELTGAPSSSHSPAWSADGRFLAFVEERNGARSLHTFDFFTGTSSPVYAVEGEWVGDPAWSPDGASIVFSRMAADSATKDVVVIALDTLVVTNLTNTPDSNERHPTFAPDGLSIAFATDRDGDWEVYTMGSDGSSPTNRTQSASTDDSQPDFSPDGAAVVYASRTGDGPSGLVLLPLADGSTADPLGPENTSAEFPVFSPDGTRIAFAATPADGDSDIWTFATDGTDLTQVTSALAEDTHPSWQPITPNEPPTANAGADEEVECTSFEGAAVTLDGTGSSDPDSTEGASDIVLFEWFEDFGTPDETFLGIGETLVATLPFGSHLVTLQVTDSTGQTDTDTVEIVVVDTTPPEISVEVSPSSIWPPNHKMVKVRAHVIAHDVCSPVTIVLESVVSSEPDNDKGDGNTNGDVQGAAIGTADFQYFVRAERQGGGSGRTYTATYSATDESGNTASAQAVSVVPHDQGSGKGKSDPSKKKAAGNRGSSRKR